MVRVTLSIKNINQKHHCFNWNYSTFYSAFDRARVEVQRENQWLAEINNQMEK